MSEPRLPAEPTPPLDITTSAASERRAAAAERRALDRRVRAVIEGMSDAFLALDDEWRVIYANREAARLNGTTPDALVGRDHWTQWPETRGGDLERAYRRAMRDRVPVQLQQYYASIGRWHDIRVFPIEDGGIAIFYRDVTAEKSQAADRARQAHELEDAHERALAAEAQFRLMVDRVRDYAVFLLDPDGIITHWGEGARRMTGWEPEEAIGMRLVDLYPPGGAAEDGRALDHLHQAAESGEYSGEGTRVWRGSRPYPARVTLTALHRGGKLVGFSAITQDLSAERERERAIVAALTAAQAASDAKSQFLANTSHEIRTPLNAIIGYAELLELELAGPLAPGQRQYVSRVQETSRHLLALVNDLLDLSRVEAGQLRAVSEPALAHEAADAALHLVETLATARHVTLSDACDRSTRTAFQGDRERVRQILLNLLSNAVRFTPAGGRVTLSCGSADHATAEARLAGAGPWTFLRVQDTGPGIAAKDRERIWEAFVQGESGHTRTVGGSGLGLTISRHLARLMGGDLTLQTEMGIGSSFTLWLPAASADAVPTPRAAANVTVDAQAAVEAMPRSGDSLAAAMTTMRDHTAGLAHVGDAILDEAERVIARYVERLRVDARTPSAHAYNDAALADHEVTLLADLAQCLSLAAFDGPQSEAMLRDGTTIQQLIATRHGAQRARLGWSEAEVRRDAEIFLEEIVAAVQRRMPRDAPVLARATELITIFVRVAERHSLQGYTAERERPPDVENPKTKTPRDE